MKQATAQHCMKSCNVKQNSESVFHYFASVKDFYAICSYSSFKKVGYVPLYPFRKATGLCTLTHFAQLIGQTGFTLCRLTWSGFEIHLITEVSVIKNLLSGDEI